MTTELTLQAPPCVPAVLATNEKVTGPPALRMLKAAGLETSPNPAGLNILDIGSGAGIVTSLVKQLSSDAKVVAADADERMVKVVGLRAQEQGWEGFQAVKVDVQDMSLFSDNTFTHVFGNMLYNFAPDADIALKETHRILRPTGTLALTTWPYISWWPLALAALRHHIPLAPALPSNPISPKAFGQTIPALVAGLENAGFVDVRVERCDFNVHVQGREWAFAAGELVRMVAGKAWGKEDFERYAGGIEGAMVGYVVRDLGYEGVFDKEMSALVAVAKKAAGNK